MRADFLFREHARDLGVGEHALAEVAAEVPRVHRVLLNAA